MPRAVDSPLSVGIWLPLPHGAAWRGEGIGRTIEFIIDGFRETGRLGRNIVFHVVATSGVIDEITASLRTLLHDDLQGITFTEIPSSVTRFSRFVDYIFSLGGRIRVNPYRLYEPSQKFIRDRRVRGSLAAHILGLNDVTLASTLGAEQLRTEVATDLGICAADLPDLRYDSLPWSCTSIETQSAQQPQGAYAAWANLCRRLAAEESPKPAGSGVVIAKRVLDQLGRVPVLRHLVGLGERLCLAVLQRLERRTLVRHGLRLSDKLTPDVWWVPSPTLPGIEFLKGSVVLNFWDCVGAEFGHLWGTSQLEASHSRLKLACHRADTIITQSFRNRDNRLTSAIRVPASKVAVCYLTTPLRYRQYLREFDRQGEKNETTRGEAANIIRAYVKRKMLRGITDDVSRYVKTGMQLETLLHFDFAHTQFAIVSTQNRPYKNVPFIVDAFLWMLDRFRLDAHLFLTCSFNLADRADPIGRVIRKRNGVGKVFCLPRIPNKVHAALYHCATCTLHPSLSEGGVGSYPFLEGMAVGTPGLAAACDYMTEGERLHPAYSLLTFSPRSRPAAARTIYKLLLDPVAAHAKQEEIFAQHAAWRWTDVAAVYESCFRSATGQVKTDDSLSLPLWADSRYFAMPSYCKSTTDEHEPPPQAPRESGTTPQLTSFAK